MKSAPLHPSEQQRLATLKRYDILDTEAESIFDDLTDLASAICHTPISLVSLIDSDRQWFKSRVGLDATQTDRSIAFCSHAILQNEVFQVPNALEDIRFADNPLVTGAPNIRFYAGAPLIAPDGNPIGTLCVIDQKPNHLNASQLQALRTLSRQVISQLELRRHNRHLARINKEREQLLTLIAHDLRSPFNSILGLSKILANKAEALTPSRIVTSAHGILSSSLRAYHLVEELLQWSQMQMDQHALPSQAENVNLMANQSIDFLSHAIELKQLNINNQIPINTLAFANSTLVKTILRNLLSNAVKFSPEGQTVSLHAKQHNNMIEISVENAGETISPAAAQRLFSAAVDSTTGTQGETGCGIGLMLCKQFIAQQGGEIWLDASFTQGAKICFTLPCVK